MVGKLRLGLGVVALVVLFLALRFLLGTLAFLFKVGVALAVGVAIGYVGYQLWIGWARAG